MTETVKGAGILFPKPQLCVKILLYSFWEELNHQESKNKTLHPIKPKKKKQPKTVIRSCLLT